MNDQNTASPSPSESRPVPMAQEWMLLRTMERQDISWHDAYRYYEREGYDMTAMDGPQTDGPESLRDEGAPRRESDAIMAERSEPYDPNNRPPLPANSAFASFDPLDRAESTPEQAADLEQFGLVVEQPAVVGEQEPSTTPPMDPYAQPAAVVEMPDAAAAGPRRFRKRPITNDAMQWTGTNQGQVWDWVGARDFYGPIPEEGDQPGTPARLWVEANSAWLNLEPGEWIIKDANGFYPCKGNTFLETYEDVQEDDGMEAVRVPRDTLVFAVPNDLTVAELFRQFGANLPS